VHGLPMTPHNQCTTVLVAPSAVHVVIGPHSERKHPTSKAHEVIASIFAILLCEQVKQYLKSSFPEERQTNVS
jgi:hypothetical protein